jgi:hypothetical protein
MLNVSKNDIDFSFACEAHRWNSMDPERRARQCQDAYIADMQRAWDAIMAIAETDEQRAAAEAEFARYRNGYLQRFCDVLSARSRTANPMVTGPARFPSGRNQKALDSERAKYNNFVDWQNRAMDAMRKAILAERTPDQVHEEEWKFLKRDIEHNMAAVVEIDGGKCYSRRSAFVTSTTGKLQRLASNGKTSMVKQALEYIRTQQREWKKPFITARNTLWSLVDAAQDVAEEPTQTGEHIIYTTAAGVVIRNYDADRVQIRFVDKPAEGVRTMLKSKAFKWSPRFGVWQRQLTGNAEYAAKNILSSI